MTEAPYDPDPELDPEPEPEPDPDPEADDPGAEPVPFGHQDEVGTP